MTPDAVTAITDFLLSAQAFFLAGRMSTRPMDRFSASWYFSGVVLLLAVAAFLGGIDHGFVQPANMSRYAIQRSDWIVLGGVTFCLLMTTAKQFFPPMAQRVAGIVAVLQFVGYAVAVLLAHSFAVVILNYSPIMLLFLAILLRGMKIARHAPDDFGRYLAVGIVASITLYALINAGVTLGILPTTGLPMPFVSYGGSSMLFSAIAIGVLLNISSQTDLHPRFAAGISGSRQQNPQPAVGKVF